MTVSIPLTQYDCNCDTNYMKSVNLYAIKKTLQNKAVHNTPTEVQGGEGI
jgi:hypothetical protein